MRPKQHMLAHNTMCIIDPWWIAKVWIPLIFIAQDKDGVSLLSELFAMICLPKEFEQCINASVYVYMWISGLCALLDVYV